jgi:hypothetical protein
MDYEIDDEVLRAIRHHPSVVAHLDAKAEEMLEMIPKNQHYKVTPAGGPERARTYVSVADSAGIHLECINSSLLKAAVAMAGR